MQKRGEKLQKAITVLITWGLLLFLFIAYERYFVTSQEAFLKESAFHSLERLSGELKAQVQRARISTLSYVQLAARDQLTDEKLSDFLKLYLKEALSYEKGPTSDSIRIARQCTSFNKPTGAVRWKQQGLTLAFSCAAGTPIYTLDLAPWIKTAFQPLGGEFDDVLIADATGQVLFQKSSSLPSITDLKSLVVQGEGESRQKSSESAGVDSAAGDAKHRSDSAGQKKDNADSELPQDPDTRRFQKLTDVSYFRNITLAGLSYKLFSVPVEKEKDGSPDNSGTLVVCGLRRSEVFDSDSHAIPYSTLIWATLIGAAIFTLSWPLAKLRYMSNTERFTPKEGWFLVFTMMFAATSITFMLLNASYTSQAKSATDHHLRELAGEIKSNFASEMVLASRQIRKLEPDREKNTLTPDYLERGSQSLDI